MAVEVFCQIINGRFVPETAADQEAMDGMARGVTYRLVATRAAGRSVRQHRMLFGLISIAVDNYADPIDSEAVLDVLKLQTGHVNVVKLIIGQVVMTPKSISFARMTQDAFNPWFQKAIAVLCRDFVPGLTEELAAQEIENRAGHRVAANDDRRLPMAA